MLNPSVHQTLNKTDQLSDDDCHENISSANGPHHAGKILIVAESQW